MQPKPDQTQTRVSVAAGAQATGDPGTAAASETSYVGPPREGRFDWLPMELSAGAWLVILLGIISTVAVWVWPEREIEGLSMWIFAKNHHEMYQPLLIEYNDSLDNEKPPVTSMLLDGNALTRRMLSGFMSDTPVADLIEVEQGVVGRVFSGPLEDVGFVDLTDLLKEEGIYEQINEPSFSQWSTRGRIFGIPHDVHPVVLAYRADILEDQLGIDMQSIETWDEFFDKTRFAQDPDNDGEAERYLLNLWYTNSQVHELLLMQAGGGFFDEDDNLTIDTELNARVMATMMSWMVGPDRVAIDAAEFSGPGNEMRLNGTVLTALMPDWLAGSYAMNLPQMSGKWKIMPLPSWQPGGLRTSVMGGTMLGITKQTDDFDQAWDAAKMLYLSPEVAKKLYEVSYIISPIKTMWDLPFYHEPSEYFGGQKVGQVFIDLAPNVPRRSSSPFREMARGEFANAMTRLYELATDNDKPLHTVDALLPEAQRLLERAQADVERQMARNVFVSDALGETTSGGEEADQ
ncbi:MAG: extracellular solute-binding protein [Planctomycetota bacterium]